MAKNKDVEEIGYNFAKGFIHCLVQTGLILCAAVIAFSLLRNIGGIGTDDSDWSPWDRSGLTIYTDAKTGVQYLGVGDALTPRIDAQGWPIIDKGGHDGS